MKDELQLLTCKAKGLSHQPTEVCIDWMGMDQETLMVLARSAIIHALQCGWKRSLDPIPEKVEVLAVDFVRGQLHEVLIDRPPLPRARPQINWLDKLIEGLSPEQKAQYLRELQSN